MLARTKFDDAPALIIRCIPKLGYPVAMIVAEESGTVLAQMRTVVIPGMGVVGSSIRYKDIREIGGLTLPYRVEAKYASPLLGDFITVVNSAEAGVAVGAATCAVPTRTAEPAPAKLKIPGDPTPRNRFHSAVPVPPGCGGTAPRWRVEVHLNSVRSHTNPPNPKHPHSMPGCLMPSSPST